MTTTEDIQVMVPVKITGQLVSDTLISAFEGGSNYWIDKFRLYSRGENRPVVGLTSCGDNIVLALSSIIIVVSGDGGEAERGAFHTLRMPGSSDLENGLKVMADKHPRHFANMMIEDGDAETADVFLQCCLFGEVRYG